MSVKIFLKLVLITMTIVLLDITLRYTIEQLHIIQVRPMTIPNYDESHLINVLSSFPFVFALIGWVYFIVIILFNYFKKKTSFPWYVNSIGGSGFLFISFLIYWSVFERDGSDNGVSYLREAIIVYVILGFLLELIFNGYDELIRKIYRK